MDLLQEKGSAKRLKWDVPLYYLTWVFFELLRLLCKRFLASDPYGPCFLLDEEKARCAFLIVFLLSLILVLGFLNRFN